MGSVKISQKSAKVALEILRPASTINTIHHKPLGLQAVINVYIDWVVAIPYPLEPALAVNALVQEDMIVV